MSGSTLGKRICQALSQGDKPSPFCCFDVLESCPNPALYIQGIGTVGLPLSDRDVTTISQSPVTQQSPFGKGTETVVDTSVRKSWQIDPEHFELRNPRFQSKITEIAQKVATDLKVACGPEYVVPQLYKLLLYEEGAFFLPHQDSEKADGMFGTLAICLPSKHTGGDVLLSHNGRKQVFISSERSEFDYAYAAWYADVTHEVKPVTSGNRLVLIYNLIQTDSAARTSASTLTDSNSRLKAVFSHWNLGCKTDHQGFPRFLVYKLSHNYTKAALSFDHLKGSDNWTIQQLKNAAQDVAFTLYLAHVEKEIFGSCEEEDYYGWGRYGGYEDEPEDVDSGDGMSSKSNSPRPNSGDFGDSHKIIDVIDSSLKLTRVIDQGGRQVADDVDLEITDIAQGDIFKRAPDDEDYSGYTGNEGVSTTHFYHDSVVVIIPRQGLMDFKFRYLSKNPSQLVNSIKGLQAEVKDASEQTSREHLTRLCTLIIQHNQELRTKGRAFSVVYLEMKSFTDSILSQTAIAALQLDSIRLFEDATTEIKAAPSLDLFDAIHASISRLGLDSLIPGTTIAVQRLKHISEKWSALLRVGGASFSESVDSTNEADEKLKGWITDQVHASFQSKCDLDADDGTALAEIAEKYGSPMLKQHVVPIVDASVNATPFAIAFAVRLFELRCGPRLSNATIELLYSQTLQAVLDSFDLEISSAQKLPPYPSSYMSRQQNAVAEDAPKISGWRLVQVLQQCAEVSLERHVAMVLEKVEESAITAPTTVFKQVIIPYLSSLLDHLEKADSLTMTGRDCGPHVLRLLQQYIIRYVGQEPQRSPSWTRPTDFITCKCWDCNALKVFLQDPHKIEDDFKMGQKRRDHLQHYFFSREGYKTNTIHSCRPGLPSTLVITKTDAQYQRERAEWEGRCDTAKRNIRDLGRNPRLKKLLGNNYTEVMNLRVADLPSTDTATSRPTPLGESPNPSGGARKGSSGKRKSDLAEVLDEGAENKKPRQEVEVVDLTLE